MADFTGFAEPLEEPAAPAATGGPPLPIPPRKPQSFAGAELVEDAAPAVFPGAEPVTDPFAGVAQDLEPEQSFDPVKYFTQGAESGYYGERATLAGLEGLYQYVLGDEAKTQEAMDTAKTFAQKSEAQAPRYTAVEDLISKGNFSDYLNWLAYTTGEQLPNIASIIATGGFGGFVGKTAGKLAANKVIDEVAARALVKKFASAGATAGLFAGSTAIETGGTSLEQWAATGDFDPLVAIAAGGAKGALELLTPAMLARRFGIADSLAGKLADRLTSVISGRTSTRIAGKAVGTAAEEMTTEALQEAIDIAARGFVDENYDVLGHEAASRILNASASAFGPGVTLGAAAGIMPDRPADETLSDEEFQAIVAGQQSSLFTPHYAVQVAGAKGFDPEFKSIFHPPERAELIQGREGGANTRLWQFDPSKVDPKDLTVGVYDLPDEPLTITSPGVTTPGAEAFGYAQLAQDKMNKYRAAQLDPNTPAGELNTLQEEADTLYTRAVTAGFRYLPANPLGATLAYVGKEDLQALGAVRQAARLDKRKTAVTSGVATDHEIGNASKYGFTPFYVSRDKAELLGRSAVSKKSFRIDLNKIAPENITAGLFDLANTTDELRPRVIAPPNAAPQEIDNFLSDMTRAYALAQTATDKDAARRMVDAKSLYSKWIKKGFRIKPVDTREAAVIGEIPKSAYHTGALYTTHRNRFARPLPGQYFVSRVVGETAADGSTIDWDKMKPGQVVLGSTKNVSVAIEQIAREAQKILQAVNKRFSPNSKIVLSFDPNHPQRGRKGTGGNIATYDGKSVIWIATGNVSLSELQRTVTQTLFHEYGHHLATMRFGNLKAGEQAYIYEAWERYVQANEPFDAQNFFLRFRSQSYVNEYMQAYAGKEAREYLEADPSLWWSFDEWIAEQIGRFFTTNTQAKTWVDKFFKSIADALRKVREILDPTGRILAAEPEVQEWMNSMIQRREMNLPPMAVDAMAKTNAESMMANARAMGIAPDPFQTPPQQSASVTPQTVMQAVNTPPAMRAQVDKYNFWIKWGWNILQLADKNRHIQELQRYVEHTRAWYIEKMQVISKANTRLMEWRGLGKEQAQRLGDFMFDVDSMSYLKPGENARWPTMQELLALQKKHKLGLAAANLYMRVRGDFMEVLDKMGAAWVMDAQKQIKDPAMLQQKIVEIQDEIKRMKAKPYFPHSRFGDYFIAVRDQGKLVFYQQFESKRANERASRQAALQFPGMQVQAGKLPEEVRAFYGVPPQLVKHMVTSMAKYGGVLTPKQLEALDLLAFDLSPANSFAKRFKKRSNVAGFSMDAQRGYANYFLHAGNHIARLLHGGDMRDQVDMLDSTLTALTGKDYYDRRGISDFLRHHLEYVMYPPNEWQAMRSAAFTFWLGFAPDSALINLTQVPMVAWPYLSARFGTAQATAAIAKATANVKRLYLTNKQLGKAQAAGVAPPGPWTEFEEAIGLGVEMGFLDESQATELAAASQMGTLQRMLAGTVLERSVLGFGKAASFLFQSAEKLNRRVVFRAAFELARQNPQAAYLQELVAANTLLYRKLTGPMAWRPENAAAFLAARDAIERSQFEYAAWARPRFMQGKKGVLLMFYMFQQNMLWYMKNSPGGKRTIALMGLAAGLSGLPFADDAKEGIKLIARSVFGSNFDPEVELRKWLVDHLEQDPDLFINGFGHYTFGLPWLGDELGIPIPGLDLSSRMGMGRVIPGFQGLSQLLTPGGDYATELTRATEDLVGAAYTIPLNVLKAINSKDPDEFKNWERVLPRAAKSLARAWRYFSTGEEKSYTGAELVHFDVNDPRDQMEIAAQALGFTPTRVRERWDFIAAQKEVAAYWGIQRQYLYDAYDVARQAKDREAIADALAAVREFNKTVPDKSLRIGQDQLLQSFKTRQRTRQRAERGLGPTGQLQGTYRDMQRYYPGAVGPAEE